MIDGASVCFSQADILFINNVIQRHYDYKLAHAINAARL
jgi:uncharacterized protein YaaN involved in tellurite resistance